MQSLKTQYLILIVILVIILAPVLLTLPTFCQWFDYSSTGQIGDTIGGLTSPFINGLAAILVFITFREQVRANRLLQEQADTQARANRLLQDQSDAQNIIDQIKSIDTNNIRIEQTVTEIIRHADMFLASNQHRTLSVYLNSALYFLSEFELAKNLLEQYNGDKNFLYKKLNYLYKIRFTVHIDTMTSSLRARVGLEGNLHTPTVVEILTTIQRLDEYFEDVNRYQN